MNFAAFPPRTCWGFGCAWGWGFGWTGACACGLGCAWGWGFGWTGACAWGWGFGWTGACALGCSFGVSFFGSSAFFGAAGFAAFSACAGLLSDAGFASVLSLNFATRRSTASGGRLEDAVLPGNPNSSSAAITSLFCRPYCVAQSLILIFLLAMMGTPQITRLRRYSGCPSVAASAGFSAAAAFAAATAFAMPARSSSVSSAMDARSSAEALPSPSTVR